MFPSLSADGKRLVWSTKYMPKAYVTVHDMASGNEKQFPVRMGSFALQSPLSGRIIIKSQDPRLNLRALLALDPKTGAMTPFLTVNGMNLQYSLSGTFSHDGKVFYYFDPNSQSVMAIDVATREQRELCQCGKIYGLSLLPDGKQLVTERPLGSNKWELALIPVAGGPVRAFGSYTGEDVSNSRPVFMPDGRSVLTKRTISSRAELLKINIATGGVESTGLIHEGIQSVQIDAARGKLYFHGTVPDLEFWVAENILSTR